MTPTIRSLACWLASTGLALVAAGTLSHAQDAPQALAVAATPALCAIAIAP